MRIRPPGLLAVATRIAGSTGRAAGSTGHAVAVPAGSALDFGTEVGYARARDIGYPTISWFRHRAFRESARCTTTPHPPLVIEREMAVTRYLHSRSSSTGRVRVSNHAGRYRTSTGGSTGCTPTHSRPTSFVHGEERRYSAPRRRRLPAPSPGDAIEPTAPPVRRSYGREKYSLAAPIDGDRPGPCTTTFVVPPPTAGSINRLHGRRITVRLTTARAPPNSPPRSSTPWPT